MSNVSVRGAYPKNTNDDEEDDFEEMPIPIVGNLEQYKLARSEWIHGLQPRI